ncbi:crosslink repair DNA glycosylase YcaQ family protein [Streptomyces sp. M10(2022)]
MGRAHQAARSLRTAAAAACHLPRRARRRTLRPARCPAPRPRHPAPVRFLPEFDNLLLGHADRTRVIPAAYKGRNGKGNQSYGTVLADGFLAALWRLDQAGDTATVTVQPLGTLGRAERDEVTDEALRMLAVMTQASVYDVRFATFLDFGD